MDVDKPVIVRVKRKSFQCAIDALWIEIQERPSKRPLLDLSKLSISEASSSRVEESKSKKVLVEHVETVNSTEETIHVVQSFLEKSSDELRSSQEAPNGRRNVMSSSIQEQLLAKAKQSQETLSRNARFDQIWKSRRTKTEQSEGEAISEMCQFYDIVRVDDEGIEAKVEKDDNLDLEDSKMLAVYLPLLREVDPAAASRIERVLSGSRSENDDDYVYDFYAVRKGAEYTSEDSESPFPLVQVEEFDDFYADDSVSDYESDDSNVENNPFNDYPDEETSDEEDDETTEDEEEEEEEEEEEDLEDDGENEGSQPIRLDHEDAVVLPDAVPSDVDDPYLDFNEYYHEYYDEADKYDSYGSSGSYNGCSD